MHITPALVLGVIGIAVTMLSPILVLVARFVHHRRRTLKKYYEVRWKGSSWLRPSDVMGPRGEGKHGFDEYYHEREEDEAIRQRIQNGDSLLIIGHPLAGKSRAAYEALKTLQTPHDIIVPRRIDVNPEDFLIARRLFPWRKGIIVLDDLDKFLEKQNFMYLLDRFLRLDTIVVATCRSGDEYDRVRSRMERELSVIFGQAVEISGISEADAQDVAERTGRSVPSRFDHHVGSIFLELDAMRERFARCSEAEKAVLRSIRRLYYAGVYRERELFSRAHIEVVCREKEGLEKRPFEWKGLLHRLEHEGFVEQRGERFWAEEAYLEEVVQDGVSHLGNLAEMMSVFSSDGEALARIGNRAWDAGLVSVLRADYARVAIDACLAALQLYTLHNSPAEYAMTQNNLGTAYRTLAEVEEKVENCRRAVGAYEEALRVYTYEDFPMDYGMTQNNLGGAYSTLAEVEEKGKNCRRAVKAYEEALRVRTYEAFPMDYGMTQNNLGVAYVTLAEVEEKGENCRRAVKAYEEALRVYTYEDFPMQYGTTQNNLGNAYRTLAEVEEKGENCRRAVKAHEEALRVYTYEAFPMQYGTTQNNLGNAYVTLAEVEEKGENCRRAVKAYEEALKAYTYEAFPMDYGMTQNNLGNAYVTLAEVEEKGENCRRAVKAYEEALKVYTYEDFPMQYGTTQNNLGNAYRTLAEVEERGENCRRAVKAYEEALRVYTYEDFPMDYGMTQNNLGNAYSTLAEVEEKGENCRRAVKAYEKALGVYTEEEFPEVYPGVADNLRRALEGVCREVGLE